MGVLGDVQAAQPHLAVVDRGEGVDKPPAAHAQALDLRADERDPGLEDVEEGVVVARLAVLRDGLAALLLHLSSLRPGDLSAGLP